MLLLQCTKLINVTTRVIYRPIKYSSTETLFRYGLMGVNGCGKSTLLACLGNREVPIQDHIDIYYLARYSLLKPHYVRWFNTCKFQGNPCI